MDAKWLNRLVLEKCSCSRVVESVLQISWDSLSMPTQDSECFMVF
jgi:hypothetical protein